MVSGHDSDSAILCHSNDTLEKGRLHQRMAPQRKWTCTVVGFVVIASTLAINTAIKECVL